MTSPRIVMIVDNGIVGDSRVQKSAREMAARGWNVTLVGNHAAASAKTQPPGTTGEYGDATVVWAPLPRTGTLSTARDFSLRHPLAFRTQQEQSRSRRRLDWITLDLQQRYGSGEGGLGRAVTKLRRKWIGVVHGLRTRATRKRDARRSAHPAIAMHGRSQWRYDDPLIADLEVAYAGIIESAKPDLIHAQDYRAIPIAVRAADRLGRSGRRPAVVYDAHEFLPGIVMADASRHRGDVQAEALYAPRADAVITVSTEVAARLMETHGYTEQPVLVYNTPMLDASSRTPVRSLRADAGVDSTSPVIVYVGAASALRGLDTVIAALPQLPGVHFVTVSKESPYIASLREAAVALGVGDRFHRVDYVPADDVSAYVAEATIGISPALHTENHDLGVATKLFEYLHARLPMLNSDIAAAARWITENEVGLIHTAGDADSFADAVRTMLADIDRFRAPYADDALLHRWSWERQHDAVDELYRRLTGGEPDARQAALDRVLRTTAAGGLPDDADLLAGSALALDTLAASVAVDDLATQTNRLIRAQDVLFHRSLHFDSPRSPLADDPAGYLSQWRATPPMSGLATTMRMQPAAAASVDGMQVTVLGYSNLAWAPPVVEAAQAAGAHVRVVDLAEVHGPISDRVLAQIALGQVPDALAEVVSTIHAESDAVWVEWAERAAVAATAVDPGTTRVIVRLHAYEAFKPALHYVQWGRVDDLVFVGPHFRDMVDAALDGNAGYAGVRRHVIPLWFDLDRFHRVKSDESRFTLAVLKWANAAKDAPWAIDVLARLREADPRYRLRLIGGDVPPGSPAGLAEYGRRTHEAVAAAGLAGAVDFLPATDDVPAALSEVGVIVSSSVRESFHAALVEGAASAAVPVVRDWPLMKRWNGPRRLFPAEWVVDDAQQAADRILAATRDADAWRTSGERAQQEAHQRFRREIGQQAVADLLAHPASSR